MARRLPIYFVLDVSESMVGEPIQQMESVIDTILADLRRNPHALESVWFSQIVFAAKAISLTPLKEITAFTPHPLPLGGGTGIGEMLRHLMKTLSSDTLLDSATGKADWKPIVYLMTDGKSTDSVDEAVREWNNTFKHKCVLIAISLGSRGDISLLRKLSDNVVVFMDTAPDAYSRFAAWISRSISESMKVASSIVKSSDSPIAQYETGLIEIASSAAQTAQFPDETTIAVIGRCQKSKKPYLLKFELHENALENSGSNLGQPVFAGATALRETYFELSSSPSGAPMIDLQSLDNPGKCILCGADHAIVQCENCKKVSCGASGQSWCCPWCGASGELVALEGPAMAERALG
jgi:hypothetical protein